jgi:hypothetical protein
VITEFMPNPNQVGDAQGEWFEVLASTDVDLNGLQLGTAPPTVRQTLASATCLSVTAGTSVLFAASDEPAVNGMLPAVNHVISFGLTNSASGLFVGIGGVTLDAVTWGTSGDGVATSLDPDFTNATDNDVAANFCPATLVYGLGDKGTPGAVNPQCP